jgi:hypothetical protein
MQVSFKKHDFLNNIKFLLVEKLLYQLNHTNFLVHELFVEKAKLDSSKDSARIATVPFVISPPFNILAD